MTPPTTPPEGPSAPGLPAAGDFPAGRLISGRWAIGIIAALAITLAAFNWWFQTGRSPRALAWWGDDAAAILRAPRVECWRLVPQAAAGEAQVPGARDDDLAAQLASRGFAVAQRKVANEARGLSNVRRSLLLDRSFAWEEAADTCTPAWQYALAFYADLEPPRVVLFSLDCPRLTRLADPREVSIAPIAAPLAAFFAEQYPPEVAP